MSRMWRYPGKSEKRVLAHSFVYSILNYGPLARHFISKTWFKNGGKIRERYLHLLLNNHMEDYQYLLQDSKSPSAEVIKLFIRSIAMFKTLNGLNSKFMAEIFDDSPYSTHKKYNLMVHYCNTSEYGDKSLRIIGAHLWNSLPDSVKHETLVNIFESAKLCDLRTPSHMRLTQYWLMLTYLRPYPLLIRALRACAPKCLYPHQQTPYGPFLVLYCVVIVGR